MGYIHLHVHSQMSLLDATIRLEPLADRAKAWGMSAVALTDHGNLFGAVQFMKACEVAGIKPIFGAEMYVADPKSEGRAFHLVLLCRNRDGFANLRTLISRSYLEGLQNGRPTTTREAIAQHAGGLVALSGCLGGEVPQALLRGDEAGAMEALDFHRRTFGDDGFWLELEGNDLAEQDAANAALIDLGRRTGTPFVATNNAHYMDREDAVAHAVLVAIDMKRTLNEEQRRNLPLRSFHFASPEEMAARFADVPEAISNTQRVADRIEQGVLKKEKKLHFPIFTTPKGETTAEYLRDLSARGLDARLDAMRRLGRTPDEQPYRDRLERELGVICSLGFDAYYLIVWDFINWAKEHEVPVGPGRGSGAGSLVAFAIGVTDIDPMRYNLLFERFLNPERVSPPDFDVDFCEARREKVIQYVTEKYGRDHVGQIITYNAMKARAVVRDVNRVMGGTFQQGDVIAKLIPAHPGVDMTLAKAAETVPELQKLLKDDPYVAELWEVAKKLEGLNRQAGKHAAGVVIADRPIAEYAPLYVADDASVVTQFNMKDLDAVGLIKFDFLGLTALTVIQNAVDIIHARTDPTFRVEDVPDDDPLVFERISAGDNAGVFQMETRGITDLVRRIKPDSIEDITAAIALFRPGPIGAGMVDDFIERKHDPRKASYPLPQLEPVLRDTYGTILYQEQVMLMASVLASFSLGGADLLRRAMGKKNPAELAKLREPFVEGCGKNGISAAVANQQFDLMEKFAGYGFNKSHSAAYAVVGYRMAYLKAHFPTEFLCAVLTAEKGDQGKVMGLMQEAREKGIPVLPPDVERSEADFTVEDVTAADGTKKGAIRFGLTAVKGIGSAAIDAIREARRDGPFDNMVDFLGRMDRRVNRRVVEALIKCGAMDRFKHTRAAMMEGLDRMMEVAASRRAEKDSRQGSLFDMPGASVAGTVMLGPNPVPEWPIRQRLALEKETIGYYLSGHPLDPYRGELERARVVPIAAISGLDSGSDVTIAGIVINRSEKVSKASQQKFAYITLEDAAGVVECFVSIKTYDQWAAVSSSDDPLIVRGVVRVEGDNDDVVRVHVSSIQRIEVARKSMFKAMVVTLDLAKVRESTVDELRDLVLRHRGPCPLTLLLRLPGVGDLHWRTASAWCVDPSDRTLQEVEALLGPDCVTMT